jgi:benzoate membrane transport protein
MPIIMAMVTGVFLQFGLNLMFAMRDGLTIAAPMTATFLLLSACSKVVRVLSPIIGALIVGVVAIAFTGAFDLKGPLAETFIRPHVYVPQFSWAAMAELVLPLAITVLAAQNAQGFAILEAVGNKPPVNAITTVCGLASLITAPFGAVSTCLDGAEHSLH